MAKSHLTLVVNTGRQPVAAESTARPGRSVARSVPKPKANQLALPFDEPVPPKLRVYVVSMDTVHGRTLNHTILASRPRTVLDLRHAALFNQYGSDRDTIFGYLAMLGSFYATEAMPWHKLSAREFMNSVGGLVPRLHHELLERNEGSVMLFVPKPEHANMLITYLHRLLAENATGSWQVEAVL